MKNIKQKLSLISKTALCCIILLSLWHPLKAQDKIYKTDSSITEAKVIEIGEEQIKYKKFNNPDGPLYNIAKDNVVMIVFENGTKEIFKRENIQTTIQTTKLIEKNDDLVKKDSVQCVEDLWGVKFENIQENDGGVRIVKLTDNSIFKPQFPIKRLSIYNVNNGNTVRVKNVSELARVLFESYNQGISKINLISGRRGTKLSKYTTDYLGIDIAGLSKCQGTNTINRKLGIDESKKAGVIVSGIYHKGINWVMPGFCSGLAFGVLGIPLVGVIAKVAPGMKKSMIIPPNVDAKAWKSGYQSKIKKKRLITGIIGSVAGSILVIAVFSSVI